MSFLRTLAGQGKLSTRSVSGIAEYKIDVWLDESEQQTANGSLCADNGMMFGAIGQEAVLELADGRPVKIVISDFKPGASSFTVIESLPTER